MTDGVTNEFFSGSGCKKLTEPTGGGQLSLPHILALKMMLSHGSPQYGPAALEFIDRPAIRAVYESVMKTCGDEEIAINMAIAAGRAMTAVYPNTVDITSRRIFDTLQTVTNGTVHLDDALYIASLASMPGDPDYPCDCIHSALERDGVKVEGVDNTPVVDNEDDEDDEDDEDEFLKASAKVLGIFSDNADNFGSSQMGMIQTVAGAKIELSPIGIANYVANVGAVLSAYKNNPLGKVERVIYGINFIAHVYTTYDDAVSPTDEQYRVSNPQYVIKGTGWTSYVNLKAMTEKPNWINGVTYEVEEVAMRYVPSPAAPVVPSTVPAASPVATPVATTVAAGVNAVQGSPPSAAPHTERKESVFTKPIPISDMLCVFLGVPQGSLMSRSEVTTRVCAYAKTHNLLDKQVIKADSALRMLLSLTPNDELRILNLQRFLKPHYLRA